MALAWRAAAVDPPGEAVPAADFWSPVSVPDRPAGMADAAAIAYATAFDDPRPSPDGAVYLGLEGGPGPISVWLNGERIARHPFPFGPLRVAIEPAPIDNELVVAFERASGRFAGAYGLESVEAARGMPGPDAPLELETTPGVHLAAFEATATWTDDGGEIRVVADIAASAEFDGPVQLSVRPADAGGPGAMERRRAHVAAGEVHRLETAIDAPDPIPWRPTPGTPALYTVRAKVGEHSRSATVGFREPTLAAEGFRLDGEPVGLRGFCLMPGADVDAAVGRALEAGANALRPFAHVPPSAFYRACAEAGIVVLQDLPLVGDVAVPHDAGRACGEAMATYLRGRPALGFVSLVGALKVDPNPLGEGLFDRLRFRWLTYRAAFDDGIVRTLAEPIAPVAPVVDLIAPPGVDSPARAVYPGVHYLRRSDAPRLVEGAAIVAATGAPAAAGTVRLHGRWRTPLELRGVADADASRAYQSRVVKTVVEAARRTTGGVFVDALFDVDATGGFGVRTADGDAKPAYRAVSASFEPVQTVLTPPYETGSVEAVLLNDRPEPLEASVVVEASAVLLEAEATVTAGERRVLGELAVPADARAVTVETVADGDRVTNTYRLEAIS